MRVAAVPTPADADALARAGVHVWLVKGAYVEATGAHPYGEPTDVAFLRLGFRVAERGATWSMATHDGRPGVLCRGLSGRVRRMSCGPRTGRRGPEELWARFDAAVARPNAAGSGDSLAELVASYGEVAQAAGAVGNALEAAGEKARWRARPAVGAGVLGSEGNVVVNCRCVRDRRGRSDVAGGSFQVAEELHGVGDDLHCLTPGALCLVLAPVEVPVDRDGAALGQVARTVGRGRQHACPRAPATTCCP
jgi:hypothetical protein